MAGYDSHDEDYDGNEQPKKRQKRFAFQSFAQRVAKVDVADVYRDGAPVREEPLAGAGSFLQEEIQKQRELHSTSHFLQATSAVNSLTQTLPLIVHHKDDVADIFLGAIRMEAGLSLEPILILVAALARDLQADFLPYVPRLAAALTALIEQGADRQPELLQHIFGCLSGVLRHLAQWLAAGLPGVLQETAPLRYSSTRHVRQLAAQSMGFLLRHARGKALRSGVRTIYAEQVMRPTEARTHGAGLLLAESLLGINHRLHSRAAAVLPLMLQEDILAPADLKGTKAQRKWTLDTLRDRAAEVNRVALDRLLQHTRRGSLQVLWDTALAEVEARLSHCEDTPTGAELAAAQRSVAHAADTVAQMVEYIRGSRVDDYAPLFDLNARLCAMNFRVSSTADGGGTTSASLPRTVLRLTAALVGAHGKDVGASGGLGVIAEVAPSWRPLLQQAPVQEVLPFVHRILHGPGAGAAAAQALGSVLLGALWRAIQEGQASVAMPLLLDMCQALQSQGHRFDNGQPLLERAEPGGEELAQHVCSVVQKQSATLAELWAALSCLQHATDEENKIVQACERVLQTEDVRSAASPDAHVSTMQLKSQALLLKASVAPTEATASVAMEAVSMLRQAPSRYEVLSMAAQLLQRMPLTDRASAGVSLRELLPLVEPNLAARSQAVRGATLRLLCACAQPLVPQQKSSSKEDGAPSSGEPQRLSSIFPGLAQIESQVCSLENGRAAANMLSGLKTAFEYSQVPPIQIRPVICALLGLLHIRFSLIWAPAAEALGMALKQHADIAWPLIFQALAKTQAELLSGRGAGQKPGQLEDTQDYDGALESLEERFQKQARQGGVGESGGCTDASVRLSTLLKALGHAPAGVVKGRAQDWVPLCLSFLSAKGNLAQWDAADPQPAEADAQAGGAQQAESPSEAAVAGAAGGQGQVLRIGARLWRGLAKDWLALLANLKDLRGVFASSALRRSLAAQILSSDSTLQQAALKGLRAFHLEYLRSGEPGKQLSTGSKKLRGTMDRLLRLAKDETLREELTSFELAADSDDAIPAAHRPGLIAVLVRLLWPRMRKRSGRLGGKGAPGSARAAILNFFTALEPAELRPLLALLLAPIGCAIRHHEGSPAEVPGSPDGDLFAEPWWADKLGAGDSAWWLGALNGERLAHLPGKQRVGLINALVDLLRHLGHRLALYLPAITAILVVLLEGAVSGLNQSTQQPLPGQAPAAGTGPVADSADTQQADQTVEAAKGHIHKAEDASEAGMGAKRGVNGVMTETTPSAPPTAEGGREVRSGALKLLAGIWSRFSAQAHDDPVFSRFFPAMAPLIGRIATEASAPAPPPLLQCVASFAASHKLALLLAEQPALLEAAISVLAAPHASAASRDASLAILESLLDQEQPLQETVLQQHTAHLLQSLQALVTAAAGSKGCALPRALKAKPKAAQRGPSRTESLRALSILERLAAMEDHSPSRGLVMQLSDALLPILATSAGSGRRRTRGDDAATLRVLGVLAAIWAKAAESSTQGTVQEEQLWRFAADLAPLAGSLDGRDTRAALAAAFAALAKLLPDLQHPSTLLTDLNAMSTTEVDAMDYDRRLQAYSSLRAEAWAGMGSVQALPLLHQSLADMRRTDDLAIRSAAAQALGRLITAAKLDSARVEMLQGDMKGKRAVDLVHTVLFQQLRRTVPAPNLAVRQEHVDLLRALALAFPAQYPDLHALTDTDAELDFFNNVAHLQLHRRSRAFKRLGNACQNGLVGSNTLMGIAVPLLQQAILEGRSREGGHEMKDRERDQEANVVDTAVQVLGGVAARLDWPRYQQLLGTFSRAMQRTEGKAIIRAVCSIIDAFHFATEAAAGADALPVPTVLPSEGAMPAPAPPAMLDAAHGEDIQRALTRRVLPALQKQLVYKDGEAVRAPVALAIVKLLKRLPEAALRAALPTSLQKVANLLRTRLQRIRDDARTVYVAMVEELGPEYLGFAIGVLRSALPSRGYTGHVQGYTVHAVLQVVMKDAQAGALDEVIDAIIPIIETELFGQVSEEKEAHAFVGGCKEAKRLRAYATYQLLAQGITFRTHMSALLQPVIARLGEASNPKARAKLQQLLQAAVQGVLANDSVSPSDLLIFIHGVLEAGVAAEEAAQAAAQAFAEAPGANPEAPEGAREQHLLMEMALALLLSAINKSTRNKIDARDPDMLGMLGGLLPFLIRAMRSRHGTVASTALRVFSVLVPLPLPGLPEQAPQAGAAMTALLRRAPDSNAPIAQECFKLLAALLRACSSYQPSTEELRFLLKWAFGDVEASRSRVAAFGLLKAAIARRLVVPEVYDLMERVQELMIKSHEPSVRQQCSGILLQYILDYPLGAKRLQHHLQFLITNLSFEHESGRQASVDTMKALILRFPEPLVEEWAPVFFMALVARLVNDPSVACRVMHEQALKTLLQRAGAALADRLAAFCMQWLSGEDARMARAAAQVTGVFAEVEGARFGRRVPGLLQILVPALERAAQEEDAGVETSDELSTFSSWQVPYFCLTLLEKAAHLAPKQVSFSAAQSLWLVLPALLSHAHLWVRKAALRLLCLGMSSPALGGSLLQHPKASPGRLALLSYQQMEVSSADEALLELAARSAALLAPLLYDTDLAAGRVPAAQGNGNLGLATSDSNMEAAEHATAAAEEAEDRDAAEDQAAAASQDAALTLHGMVRRVARTAGETSWVRQGARLAALRLLAALALRLKQERGAPALLPYLPAMMLPLVRQDERSHNRPNLDAALPAHLAEADALGREIMAQLKAAAGDEAYLQALVQAKQHATAMRRLRRKQQASEKLADPELASQRRARKLQRRGEGQKKKREELKRQRSTGLAVKNRRDKRVKS